MAEDQNHKYLELSPGATIADYQVIRELGRGAMAVVYLAQQLNLARPVALKIMASALAEKPEFVSRFINEVRTAAALSHANIVQAFDAGVIDSRIYYFAMEYIDGETVLQKIKREGRLEVTEGLRIAIAIAGALNYGWQRHEFTHGDIKPENIMLTADGIPKLADFGLANARGHEYKGETMLTPHYAAPELIRGEQEGHSCLSDIYAFGASLYHILSGTTPYPGDNARTVMNRHLKEPLEPLIRREPSVPAVVSDFVGQMLAKNPAARPQNWEKVVQGLKTCLQKVEQGEGGTAAQAGISPKRLVVSQARAQARRQVEAVPRKGRGILNILILLSVLVLAAVAGVLVFQKVQQQRIRRSLEGLPMDGDYEVAPENGQIVPETEESSPTAEEAVPEPESPSTAATVNPPTEPEVASVEVSSKQSQVKQSQPEAKPDRPAPQPDV
ncbi:MAG: protein kinase, partial [Victivallales bacterium]|nr:protein kinase [Victivallales bacterium]